MVLQKNIKEVTSDKIGHRFFSLSIDKSTNSANDKISNVLVPCFDEEVGCVRTEILGCAKENLANAENIPSHVKSIAANNDLELDNCMSIFMDNCAVMRGKQSGVETRMRADNPNLLDVHGDTVHVVNNAAKSPPLSLVGIWSSWRPISSMISTTAPTTNSCSVISVHLEVLEHHGA